MGNVQRLLLPHFLSKLSPITLSVCLNLVRSLSQQLTSKGLIKCNLLWSHLWPWIRSWLQAVAVERKGSRECRRRSRGWVGTDRRRTPSDWSPYMFGHRWWRCTREGRRCLRWRRSKSPKPFHWSSKDHLMDIIKKTNCTTTTTSLRTTTLIVIVTLRVCPSFNSHVSRTPRESHLTPQQHVDWVYPAWLGKLHMLLVYLTNLFIITKKLNLLLPLPPLPPMV